MLHNLRRNGSGARKQNIDMKLMKSMKTRQAQRVQKIKFFQQHKIGSEISIIKVKSASDVFKCKQKKRRFLPEKDVLFRKGTNLDYAHTGSFQEAIGGVLLMAQLFSLMPVRGITSTNVADLSFSWWHLRTIYSMIIIVCFGICWGFSVSYSFIGTFSVDGADTIVFSSSTILIALGFFKLSRKWPRLQLHWHEVEQKLPALRTEKERGRLAHRIKIITLVATFCSLIEHLLSMLSVIYYANNCPTFPNNPIESYLYSNFSQFFHFVRYSTIAGIIGKVLNVMSTFVWNFNDIFVMTVSVALSTRFHQLNEYMSNAIKKPMTEDFWIKCRVNYRSLCKLVLAVDDAISSVTFVCFANNLYFICVKILKSLQKKPSFSHTIYFWFSLTFLLVRTLVLSLYTADINDESKRPVIIFRGIHRDNWCRELKRFSEEVTTDVVALSGMKFFHLTRSFVISVAGTIVTYELVLLQFNKDDKIHDCYE